MTLHESAWKEDCKPGKDDKRHPCADHHTCLQAAQKACDADPDCAAFMIPGSSQELETGWFKLSCAEHRPDKGWDHYLKQLPQNATSLLQKGDDADDEPVESPKDEDASSSNASADDAVAANMTDDDDVDESEPANNTSTGINNLKSTVIFKLEVPDKETATDWQNTLDKELNTKDVVEEVKDELKDRLEDQMNLDELLHLLDTAPVTVATTSKPVPKPFEELAPEEGTTDGEVDKPDEEEKNDTKQGSDLDGILGRPSDLPEGTGAPNETDETNTTELEGEGEEGPETHEPDDVQKGFRVTQHVQLNVAIPRDTIKDLQDEKKFSPTQKQALADLLTRVVLRKICKAMKKEFMSYAKCMAGYPSLDRRSRAKTEVAFDGSLGLPEPVWPYGMKGVTIKPWTESGRQPPMNKFGEAGAGDDRPDEGQKKPVGRKNKTDDDDEEEFSGNATDENDTDQPTV